MTTRPALALVALCAVTAIAVPAARAQQPAAGPARPEAFRSERPVYPGGRGPNRLAVDVPLLLGTERYRALVTPESAGADRQPVAVGGLGDLRLYDGANREVPYLLVSPPTSAPTWRAGRILPVASTDTTSGFEVDLEGLTTSDRLRLEGLPAPFLKRVRLEGSGDRTRWTLLVGEGTLFDLPDEQLRATELEYLPGAYRYLRVTWDDRSSGVVPTPSAASVRVAFTGGAAAAPLRADVPVERRPSEPGKSRYRLRLPGARLPIVALELEVRGGNVLREAQVTEARLSSAGEVAPALLGRATLRRTVRDGVAAAALRISIAPPAEATIDLVVDDGDNPPLALTGVTAVFAALPFLYFESDSAQTLVARFGAPDVAAPRYDLEAVRDSVSALATAEARWGPVRGGTAPAAVGVAAAGAGVAAGASIDPSTFRYSRPIAAGGAGLAALRLDTAVLAHSALSDLRIVGPNGQQLPYLLERMDEPYVVLLAPLASDARDARAGTGGSNDADSDAGTRSRYRLRLPAAHLPAARLVLETSARVFRRRVAVEVTREPTERRRERYVERVAEATWSHADPETPAPALTLALPSLDTAVATLVVDEGDNDALPLAMPKLLLPSYRVRFFRDAGVSPTLVYGKAGLAAPRYDLALLAPRLLGAPADEVTMGPERQAPPAPVDFVPGWIFWGVLATAVVVLLLLIVRLVRESGVPPSATTPPPASPGTPPTTPPASEVGGSG